jgi:hypothetical protein
LREIKDFRSESSETCSRSATTFRLGSSNEIEDESEVSLLGPEKNVFHLKQVALPLSWMFVVASISISYSTVIILIMLNEQIRH